MKIDLPQIISARWLVTIKGVWMELAVTPGLSRENLGLLR